MAYAEAELEFGERQCETKFDGHPVYTIHHARAGAYEHAAELVQEIASRGGSASPAS
jgi:hypothetical protein